MEYSEQAPRNEKQQERFFSLGIWEGSNQTSHLPLIIYLKIASFNLYPHIACKAASSSFAKRPQWLTEIFQQMTWFWFQSSIVLLPKTPTQAFRNTSTRVKLFKSAVSHSSFTLLGEDRSSTPEIILLSPPQLLWAYPTRIPTKDLAPFAATAVHRGCSCHLLKVCNSGAFCSSPACILPQNCRKSIGSFTREILVLLSHNSVPVTMC